MTALRGEWAHTRGLRVYTRIGGSPAHKPAVVFVHGLIVSSRYTVPTATRLASRALVVAPDLPGFGRSSHPPAPLMVPGLADALGDVVQQLAGAAVFVANSFGCAVTVELAVRRPELIRSLVLTSPAVNPDIRRFLPAATRWLRTQAYEPPALQAIVVRDAWRAGSREDRATIGDALRYRIEDRLPAIDIPALVVRGRKDRVVAREWAEQVTRLLPQGRFVELPAAHALPYDAPSMLAALVEQELERARTE